MRPARRQPRPDLPTSANFGAPKRHEKDQRPITEILGLFDLVAEQEVADDRP